VEKNMNIHRLLISSRKCYLVFPTGLWYVAHVLCCKSLLWLFESFVHVTPDKKLWTHMISLCSSLLVVHVHSFLCMKCLWIVNFFVSCLLQRFSTFALDGSKWSVPHSSHIVCGERTGSTRWIGRFEWASPSALMWWESNPDCPAHNQSL
jgi:hypothetical protein